MVHFPNPVAALVVGCIFASTSVTATALRGSDGLVPISYTAEALKDLVTKLPGQPAQPEGEKFRMFSGYINVNDDSEPKDQSRDIFYWFVESMNNPKSDPVGYWTNGGPGCSGVSGFLTEQGPYRPIVVTDANGQEKYALKQNKFPWNKVANMVFVEQPAGVGFSTAPESYKTYNDATSAADNRRFIIRFFERFPHLKQNDFYITSESYGGHYMPTLAYELVHKGGVPNFKGFAVGNPLTWMKYRNYGQAATLYGHQMIPKPTWEKYEKLNCLKTNSERCQQMENEMMAIVGPHIDPYGIDFPVCNDPAKASGRLERLFLQNAIKRSNNNIEASDLGDDYFPSNYQPCRAQYAGGYLNQKDVQEALHVVGEPEWSECNGNVGAAYNLNDVATPMMPVYQKLFQEAKLRILIYSGDDDTVCATFGSQQFIWDMGYEPKSYWQPWMVQGQLGGFLTKFETFSFLTVHGAGHMVPATRPEQALELFSQFLNGSLNVAREQTEAIAEE